MSVVLFRETLETGCITLTVQVAFFEPLGVETVMTVFPGAMALTVPPETVATSWFELVQIRLSGVLGAVVRVRVRDAPTFRVASDTSSAKVVKGISSTGRTVLP
jgi:hypothetical protein